jgi:hypothetical protein
MQIVAELQRLAPPFKLFWRIAIELQYWHNYY